MPRNDNKCNKFILIRTTKNFVLSGSMPKKKNVCNWVSRVRYTNQSKTETFWPPFLSMCVFSCLNDYLSWVAVVQSPLDTHSIIIVAVIAYYGRITQFSVCLCVSFIGYTSILCDFFPLDLQHTLFDCFIIIMDRCWILFHDDNWRAAIKKVAESINLYQTCQT